MKIFKASENFFKKKASQSEALKRFESELLSDNRFQSFFDVIWRIGN